MSEVENKCGFGVESETHKKPTTPYLFWRSGSPFKGGGFKNSHEDLQEMKTNGNGDDKW